jgi:uncharacterized membrane protein (UPF0127 family)
MLFGVLSCQQKFNSELPVIELSINGHEIIAEVANTIPTLSAGLMFRTELGENNGMLFVFKDSEKRAFWMKNTLIPLSIAFIDEKGKIENIAEMPPKTEHSFYSDGPARFALEMNSGWFSKNGLKPGDFVQGALQAPVAKN